MSEYYGLAFRGLLGTAAERESAVRLRDMGPSRWQHRVVGGELLDRQVAGCSAQCVARCRSRAGGDAW